MKKKSDLEKKFQAAMSAAKNLDSKAFHAAIQAAQEEFNKGLTEVNAANFNRVHKETMVKIDKCLKTASDALDQAVKLSEETGIPFHTYINDMDRSRLYMPNSFNAKWPNLDRGVLEEHEIYSYDAGWEYWSTSSLSC